MKIDKKEYSSLPHVAMNMKIKKIFHQKSEKTKSQLYL